MRNDLGARATADEVVRDVDLRGRTAVVTGANTGIGYETARALASAGARVVLACRSAERGARAAARIRAAHPGAIAEPALLDLASLSSVRAFGVALDAEKVDVLVCNAGVLVPDHRETAEGFELTVGVCHVGHFLLVTELLPRLLAARGRVVMVSSESHRSPRTLEFERFPLRREGYSAMVAYGQAKLCNVLFANELARRYGDRGLTACSLHPGNLVTTEIGRNSWLFRLAMRLASPFTKSASQGAATVVLCAVDPDVDALQGRYFSHCQPRPASREALDPAVAQRLWELSEKWIAAVPPAP